MNNVEPGDALHCVVTAGPTYEELDRARRITNFSTGRLGCELAGFLHAQGIQVTLLIGEQSTWRGERRAWRVKTFTTGRNLAEQLEALGGPDIDAVFHAAAVSDFQVGKVWAKKDDGALNEVSGGKLSSREGTLLAELVPTPKIISQMRDWFPGAVIVGWKYEVDASRESVLASAREQIVANRTDACVANGPAYGAGYGLVTHAEAVAECQDNQELFEALAGLLS
jgi:phosphopantothenate---cysteine ligase (CTP)